MTTRGGAVTADLISVDSTGRSAGRYCSHCRVDLFWIKTACGRRWRAVLGRSWPRSELLAITPGVLPTASDRSTRKEMETINRAAMLVAWEPVGSRWQRLVSRSSIRRRRSLWWRGRHKVSAALQQASASVREPSGDFRTRDYAVVTVRNRGRQVGVDSIDFDWLEPSAPSSWGYHVATLEPWVRTPVPPVILDPQAAQGVKSGPPRRGDAHLVLRDHLTRSPAGKARWTRSRAGPCTPDEREKAQDE